MFFFYKYLTIFLHPIFLLIIYLRKIFNKEDKKRFKEKINPDFFSPSRNYKKKLIWFHAASIGEMLSIIPLIKRLNKKNFEFLITTVTLSSSEVFNIHFNKYKNIKHRFFPIDNPKLVNKFLDIWKPDLISFVDSEIWPNFLKTIKSKGIPLILLNARITNKTFKKWNIFKKFSKEIFECFNIFLSANENTKKNLSKFKLKNIKYLGNLKFTLSPNPVDLNNKNKKIINKNRVWCAASTHDTEELFCLKTHIKIKRKYKNSILIIIPRHIHRVNEIKKICEQLNLDTQIIKKNELIKKGKEILIINSFGFLANFYKCCDSVFIGKSLIKKLELVGGQNPIEAAKLGCKVYSGPYTYNFEEIYRFLKTRKIAEVIKSEKELSEKLIADFDNKFKKSKRIKNVKFLKKYGENILENTFKEFKKQLTR